MMFFFSTLIFNYIILRNNAILTFGDDCRVFGCKRIFTYCSFGTTKWQHVPNGRAARSTNCLLSMAKTEGFKCKISRTEVKGMVSLECKH